jgi:hypothetical protein
MNFSFKLKAALVYILVFALPSCHSNPSTTPVLTPLNTTLSPSPNYTIEEIDQPHPTDQILAEAIIAPTVDISMMNVSLKQELYFSWAAEGGPDSPSSFSGCTTKLFEQYGVSDESRQEFFTNGIVPSELIGTSVSPFFSSSVDYDIYLCIYGFPEDAILTIELYTPEDTLCVSQDVRVSDYYYLAIGEITEVDFALDWPRCSHAGQWTLFVKSAGISLKKTIWINQYEITRLRASILCDSPDGYISVQGARYPPGESRLLGVYGDCSGGNYDDGYASTCALLESYLIEISNEGSFDVLLTPNLLGEYIVVPIERDTPPDYGGVEYYSLSPGVIYYPEVCDYLRDEAIFNVIKQFNADQTLAVRTLDSQILHNTCTAECLSWNTDYIDELREDNLYEVQEQLAFEVTLIDILDNVATVTTRETWRTQKHDWTTHECLYHQPTFDTQQTYILVYSDQGWKVSRNDFDTPVPADQPGCLE